MSERFKWFFGGGWLVANLLLLAFPVFVPSIPYALITPIDISTAAMFVLSFPASTISLLLTPVIPHSIAGMFMSLNIIFLLGAVQWFVVVPKFLRGKQEVQTVETAALPQYVPPVDIEAFDSDARTPVERVFDDEK